MTLIANTEWVGSELDKMRPWETHDFAFASMNESWRITVAWVPDRGYLVRVAEAYAGGGDRHELFGQFRSVEGAARYIATFAPFDSIHL